MEIIVVALLIIAAVGAVLAPLLRRDAGAPDPAAARGTLDPTLSQDDIDREVVRYRAALVAGAVCTRCAQANPPGSRFCSDCGRPLKAATSPVATKT
jgi:hypothetical protein